MKKILAAIDFSTHADNAAQYALGLANVLKSKVILCNAYVPTENAPGKNVELNHGPSPVDPRFDCFANQDEAALDYVDCRCEVGTLTVVVNQMVSTEKISLIVMGMSQGKYSEPFFLGSHSQEMIDQATCPVLLIPLGSSFQKLRKIAFATDLHESDIHVIHSLVSLCRYFNAEILLVHVTEEKSDQEASQRQVNEFLSDVTCKINYSKIYYRHISASQIDEGLNWLNAHGMIDMMAMVHRNHGSYKNLFTGSHTKAMASHTDVPLLVFPASQVDIVF